MDETARTTQQAAAVVDHMMAHDAFSQWLGIEVVQVEPGAVTLRMPLRAEMTNGFGIGHGGVTFALADSALAFASNGYGTIALALDNTIHYTEPARVGDMLTATATEMSRTNRIGLYDVEVARQDGVLVAQFRGTVYRTRTPHELGAPGSTTASTKGSTTASTTASTTET